MTSLRDVKLYTLKTIVEPDGNLVALESNRDIPFLIKRIFYVYGVHNQNDRGEHSHYKTKQVLVPINGSVDILCDDGNERVTYHLNKKNQALYIQEQLLDVISGVTRYNCDNATREENVQEQIERITRWIAAMSSAKEELEKKDR